MSPEGATVRRHPLLDALERAKHPGLLVLVWTNLGTPVCVCVCVRACVLRGWGPEGQTCSINCALLGLRLWGPCRTQAAHRLPLSPEDDRSADPRSPPSPIQLLPCCGHRLDKEMGETVERMLLIRRSKCKRRRLEACPHEAVLI